MSDSPCIPLPRMIPQTTFVHCHVRPLDGHQAFGGSRFAFRERLPAGPEAIPPKVIGLKRKNDDSDVSMSESRTPPGSPRQAQDMDREYVKRTKTGKTKDFPLSKLLATLNKPQLVSIINNLVDAHPNLEAEIAANVPRPTLQSVQSVLADLEKRLHESFPYTKWGPGKDDYSFNRVKPTLLELKDTILDYAAHFTSPDEFPTTTFSFLHLATSVAHRLPEWANNEHNEIKRELYAELVDYWKKAISDAASKANERRTYGQQAVSEWARHLAQHNQESNGAFQQVTNHFAAKLGWIIGIAPAVPSASSAHFAAYGNAGLHHHQTHPLHHHPSSVTPS